jgi:hypothetical protein
MLKLASGPSKAAGDRSSLGGDHSEYSPAAAAWTFHSEFVT